MTKKDYILIAKILHDKKPITDYFQVSDYNNRLKMWMIIVESFEMELQYTNPLFNHTKFLVACGYID